MANHSIVTTHLLAASPLRQPRVGKLILLGLATLVLVGVLGLASLVAGAQADVLLVLGFALLLAAIASLPALALLWYLDRREREASWLFFSVFLWGAIVATGLSMLLNRLGGEIVTSALNEYFLAQTVAQERADMITSLAIATLVGPPVEEIAKGLAILLVLWLLRGEFNNLRDGLIYGGLVGLGFNWVETAFYIMVGYQAGDPAVAHQLVGRFALLGLDGHFLFSALLGAGLGLAAQSPQRKHQILWGLGGLTAAILAHMINNSVFSVSLPFLIKSMGADITGSMALIPLGIWWAAVVMLNLALQFFSYAVLLVALYVSSQWERHTIQAELQDEIGISVTPEEYEQLKTEQRFGLRKIPGYPARTSRAIVNAQNELAFRKKWLSQTGQESATDVVVLAWRDRISHLRSLD